MNKKSHSAGVGSLADNEAARQAASAAFDHSPDSLEATLVPLDLDKAGYRGKNGEYEIAAALKWIEVFQQAFAKLVTQGNRRGLTPAVAVFADHFTPADADTLRQVGAVLFDRSLPCNRETPTFSKLMDGLRSKLKNLTHVAHQSGATAANLPKPPTGGISREDLTACNSYPHGVGRDDLEEIMRILNAQ